MFRPKKKLEGTKTRKVARMAQSDEKSCMKYYYKDPIDFEKYNLDCSPRPWPGGLKNWNDLNVYTPQQLGDYIDNYFSSQNFEGDTPFEFKENYIMEEMDSICHKNEFKLNPPQKFLGMFINENTDFNGILINHQLGAGKTCTSIVIGEAMKSVAVDMRGNIVPIPNREPFKVIIVAPKNVQEQFYEEIVGSVKNGTIQSCPAGCVVLQGDSGPIRQIYVGNQNPQTGKYNYRELEQLEKLQNLRKSIENNQHSPRSNRKQLQDIDRNILKITNTIRDRISAVYYIVSRDTFLNRVMKTEKMEKNIFYAEPTDFLLTDDIFHSKNSLIIIDEIHTLVREYNQGSSSNYRRLLHTLMYYARNKVTGEPAMKVVLLTATPVYDNPHEAAMIVNLLRPRIPFPLSRKKFNKLFLDPKSGEVKNKLLFKYMCSGYVSYFKGGNPNGFPYRRNHVLLHRMKSSQQFEYTQTFNYEKEKEEAYKKKGTNLENLADEKEDTLSTYFTLSKQKCNIVYPSDGQNNNFKNSLQDIYNFSKLLVDAQSNVEDNEQGSRNRKAQIVLDLASQWSLKFANIVTLAYKSPGPVFIYTNYVNHGILGIVSILNALGWKFITDPSQGPKYAIWSPGGLEKLGNIYGMAGKSIAPSNQNEYTINMRKIFNSPSNADGSKCKIIIGSVVEGISLRRVRQIHLCEPWWNQSKMEQIIARGIRFCSHADLPPHDRYVDVYYHSSVYSDYNPNSPSETIDQLVYRVSERKQVTNISFEKTIKESAIDCKLNKLGNIVRLERFFLPNMRNEDIYYDRVNNTHYIALGQNLQQIQLSYTSGWPATSYKVLPNTIDQNNAIITQSKTAQSDLNILLYENINCNLDNNVSNMTFKDLYSYAIAMGEEFSAWNYCYDTYRKYLLLPRITTKYKIYDGGIGGKLANCLYSSLANPKKFGLTNLDVKQIENFLIKPNYRLERKKQYKEFLLNKTNIDPGYISNLNFVQLEILAKKYNF